MKKRAFAVAMVDRSADNFEDLPNEPLLFVSGLVWLSVDESQWEVELVDVVRKGKHVGVKALSAQQQEDAKDLLCDEARRAEQAAAHV